MSSTEANYSFTTKINGDLFTVRGDTHEAFKQNIDNAIFASLPGSCMALQEAVNNEAALTNAAPLVQATTPIVQQAQAATPGVVSTTVETVQDRWGNSWTYGLPQAPALPDGRGQYVLKQGRSKAGKPYKGWFDPANGPRDFPVGAVEAPAIFDGRS